MKTKPLFSSASSSLLGLARVLPLLAVAVLATEPSFAQVVAPPLELPMNTVVGESAPAPLCRVFIVDRQTSWYAGRLHVFLESEIGIVEFPALSDGYDEEHERDSFEFSYRDVLESARNLSAQYGCQLVNERTIEKQWKQNSTSTQKQ